MGFQESFDAYKNGIGSYLGKTTTKIDDKPRALIVAYKAYLDKNPPAEGKAPPSMKDWARSESSKKERDAIAGLKEEDILAAIAAVERDKDIEAAYKKLSEDGKGLGGWLGKNWPLLAAVAAPLLLGNFFEIGTIGTLLVGIAGLAAATYFATEDSMLGGVKQFVFKQLNLPDPFAKAPTVEVETKKGTDGKGADGPAVDPNAPVVVKDFAGTEKFADFKKRADMVDVDVDIGTPPAKNVVKQKVALLGKTNADGTTTFNSYALLDKDGKPVGTPIPLPDDVKKGMTVGKAADGKTPTVTLNTEARGNLITNRTFIEESKKQAEEAKKAADVEAEKAASAGREKPRDLEGGKPNEVIVESSTSLKINGFDQRVAFIGEKGTGDKKDQITFSKMVVVDAKTGKPNNAKINPAGDVSLPVNIAPVAITGGVIDQKILTGEVTRIQGVVTQQENTAKEAAGKLASDKAAAAEKARLASIAADPLGVKTYGDPTKKEIMVVAEPVKLSDGKTDQRIAFVGTTDGDTMKGKATFTRAIYIDVSGKPVQPEKSFKLDKPILNAEIKDGVIVDRAKTFEAPMKEVQAKVTADKPVDKPKVETPAAPPVKPVEKPEAKQEPNKPDAPAATPTDVTVKNGTVKIMGSDVPVALVGKSTQDEATFDKFVLLDTAGKPSGEPLPLRQVIKSKVTAGKVADVVLTKADRDGMAADSFIASQQSAEQPPAPKSPVLPEKPETKLELKKYEEPTAKSMKVLQSDDDTKMLVEYGTFKVGDKELKVAARGAITGGPTPDNLDAETTATLTELVVLDKNGKPTDVVAPLSKQQEMRGYFSPGSEVNLEFNKKDMETASTAYGVKVLSGVAAGMGSFNPALGVGANILTAIPKLINNIAKEK